MKVNKIIIKNFRLLKDVSIDLDDTLTLIVGKNNSGKTSFLKFLSMVYNNNKISFDDYPIIYRNDLYKIIKKLHESSDNYDDIVKKIKLPSMVLEISYKDDTNSDNLGFLSNFFLDLDEDCTDVVIEATYEFRKSKDFIDKMFENIDDKNEEEIKKVVADNFSKLFELRIYAVNPKNPNIKLERDKSSFNDLFNVYIISAERLMDEDSDIKNNAPFKNILNELFKEDYEETYPEVVENVKKLNKFVIDNNKVLQNNVDEILNKIVTDAVVFGYPDNDKNKIRVNSNIDIASEIKNSSELKYVDETLHESLPETYNGLGYKNLLSIEFKVASFVHEMRKYSNSKIPILIIEEPESHMHPQIQQKFIKFIKKYINKFLDYDKGNNKIQILITTHSSHVANEISFSNIRYVRKYDGYVEYKNLDVFAEENKENAEFIKKYLTLTKCDMFFADKIILVEGASERILIPYFIDNEFKKREEHITPLAYQYFSIIEVGGAYAYKFINFLDFLGTPTLILTDIDSVKKDSDGKIEACQVNEGITTSNATIKHWIKLVKDKDEINDSREKISLSDIIKLDKELKTYKKIHIEYQVEEKVGEETYHARSLEDSIINSNLGVHEIKFNPNSESKVDFALKILGDSKKYKAPKYIYDGLKWLEDSTVDGDKNDD